MVPDGADSKCFFRKIGRNAGAAWWIPTLYFAEGAPASIFTEVSVPIFMSFQMSEGMIALWSNLLGLVPILLIKILWAPFVDAVSTKRFWIIMTQISMAVVFFFSAAACCAGSLAPLLLISTFALGAFFSATHDVAADGYYIIALSEREQALYSGLRSVFFRVAMIAANGGLILFAGFLSDAVAGEMNDVRAGFVWMISLLIPGILMGLLALYHWMVLPEREEKQKSRISGRCGNGEWSSRNGCGEKNSVSKKLQEESSEERIGIRQIWQDFRQSGVLFFKKRQVGTVLLFLLFFRL